MLLVIHNLPSNIRYNDIKALIQSKCGLTEVILDNLLPEGTGKKVTVGVAEEGDAAILVRKINGIYLSGQQLYVEDARRKKASEQPYRSTLNLIQESVLHSSYQESSKSSTTNQDSAMSALMQTPMAPNYMNMSMNQMYYMPPVQNTLYEGYGGQSQQMTNPTMSQYQQPIGQMDQSFAYDTVGNNSNLQGAWSSDLGCNIAQSSFPPQEVPDAQPRRRSPEGFSRPDRDFSARGRERRDEPSRRRPQSRSPPRGRDQRADHWQRDLPAGNEYDRGQQRPVSDRSDGFQPENLGRNTKPRFVQPCAPPVRPSTNTHNRDSRDHVPPRGNSPRWEDTEAFRAGARQTANSQQRYRQERPDRIPPLIQQNRGPRTGIYNWRCDTNAPPPKRMRPQNSDNEEPRTKRFAAQRPDDRNRSIEKHRNDMKTNLPKPINESATKIKNRTETYRGQATAVLLKDMASNPKLQISVGMFPLIKTSLRERINILTEGTSDVPPDDIIKLYRLTFPKKADRAFLNKVNKTKSIGDNSVSIKKVNQAQGASPGTSQNQDGGQKVGVASNLKPFVPKFSPGDKKPPVFDGAAKPDLPRKKIPKYAEGSKKLHLQTKKQNKNESTDPTIYTLEPPLDRILNEEIDIIVNMFVEEFKNPETEMDHQLKEKLTDKVIEELKWVIKLPTTKRILDIKTNLLIRICGRPKPPKRVPLEEFLRQYGVVSLKKSERKPLYVAGCDTYDNYDKLCNLGEVVIDNIACSFKPMHVVGVLTKTKAKQLLRQSKTMKDFAAVQMTRAGIKVEKKENDAEVANNNVAMEVKKELDPNDGAADVDSKAAYDPTNSDSTITKCEPAVNDTVAGESGFGLDNKVIDSVNDANVKDENTSFNSEETYCIADINEVIADMHDDDDDDDDNDDGAHHDVNFGNINLDELADVDVKDLEDDDLEDY